MREGQTAPVQKPQQILCRAHLPLLAAQAPNWPEIALVAAREGSLVIDVASGGNLIDVAAAKRRGISVVNAGSLPGK